jgi:hypothetical protein
MMAWGFERVGSWKCDDIGRGNTEEGEGWLILYCRQAPAAPAAVIVVEVVVLLDTRTRQVTASN